MKAITLLLERRKAREREVTTGRREGGVGGLEVYRDPAGKWQTNCCRACSRVLLAPAKS